MKAPVLKLKRLPLFVAWACELIGAEYRKQKGLP